MWNQIVKELKRNRILIRVSAGMAAFNEGCFLLASWKDDLTEMGGHTGMVIFMPCACVAVLAAVMMIRRVKAPEESDTIRWFPAQAAAYFLYSLAAGLASFLCCRFHILRLSARPGTVPEMAGLLGWLVRFYTGLEITVTAGTSVLMFLLYVLSVFLAVGAHALPEALMRRTGVPRGSRAVIQMCVFAGVCFAVRALWSLPTTLTVKVLLALAACTALTALCRLCGGTRSGDGDVMEKKIRTDREIRRRAYGKHER